LHNNCPNCTKGTATRDLTELVEKFKVLDRSREVGAGTTYVLIGSYLALLAHKAKQIVKKMDREEHRSDNI
jgi:hypothetical protein